LVFLIHTELRCTVNYTSDLNVFTDLIYRKSGVVETVLTDAEPWQCVS